MLTSKAVILALSLTLIISVGSALAQGDILIVPHESTLAADGDASTLIDIQIAPGSYHAPLTGTISLDPPSMGTLGTTTFTLTDTVTTTFTANTASGTVNVVVNVTDGSTPTPQSASNTTTLTLTAGSAYALSNLTYTQYAEVHSLVPITVRVVDRFGNPMPDAVLGFVVSSPSGDAYFTGTPNSSTMAAVSNASGYADVTLKVDRKTGDNIVWIDAPSGVSDRWFDVIGYGSVPYSITQTIVPWNLSELLPAVPANGVNTFTITYTVRDIWGNPSPYYDLLVTTDIGERATVKTNYAGIVEIIYGPKRSVGPVTITAAWLETPTTVNPSVSCTQTVTFVACDAGVLHLVASAENLASLDVDGTSNAEIRARLTDIYGNPIAGETIGFAITDSYYHPAQAEDPVPQLSADEAVTDSGGYASVTFTPGLFTVNDTTYYGISNCTIQASYGSDLQETVLLSWRNYPYLRLETYVSNTTVAPCDEIDVTLRLIGDGPKLEKRLPVDVILATSRASSMFSEAPEDRMVNAFVAQQAFIDVLEGHTKKISGEDRIGLASFAEETTVVLNTTLNPLKDWPANAKSLPGADNSNGDDKTYINDHYNTTPHYYDDDTTVDLPLNNWSYDTVRQEINNTRPWSTDTNTLKSSPLRNGLYTSIQELNSKPPEEEKVRAVVVLLDSSFKWYGDPVANKANQAVLPAGTFVTQGTGQIGGPWYAYPDLDDTVWVNPLQYHSARSTQNMSYFALSNGIRIYIVTVGSTQTEWNNQPELDAMDLISGSTGGFHRHAENAAELISIYEDIARDLTKPAGVNTTLNLSLVSVQDQNMSWSSKDLMDYVYVRGFSTSWQHYSWAGTGDPLIPGRILRSGTMDHTNEWNTHQQISYDTNLIGTLRIKETWTTTFRMKINCSVNETVQFKLFGNDSRLKFENMDTYTDLPIFGDTITIVPGLTTQLDSGFINLTDLQNTTPPEGFLNLTWNVRYTGTPDSTTRTLYYSLDDGMTWIHHATWEENMAGKRNIVVPESYNLDLRGLPGTTRLGVKVVAEAGNAGKSEDIEYFDLVIVKNYIKIE